MIFESPDGGKTIYGRLPHTLNTVELNPLSADSQELNNLWFQWRDILTAAKTNPTLKDALETLQRAEEQVRIVAALVQQ